MTTFTPARLTATVLLTAFTLSTFSSSQQPAQPAPVPAESTVSTFDSFKEMYARAGLDLNELTSGPDWAALVSEAGADSASHAVLNLAFYGCSLARDGFTRESIQEAHLGRLPGGVSAASFIDFGIDNCDALNL